VLQRGIRRRIPNAPRICAFAFDVYAAGAHSPRCSIRHTLRRLHSDSAFCLLFLLIYMTSNPLSVSYFF
jgi:hypothetical protein